MNFQHKIKTDRWMDWSRSMEDWPCPIKYNRKETDVVNSLRFLAARPAQIISSDGVFYSLSDGVWKETSKQQLYAEIHATDRLGELDMYKIKSIAEAIHAARLTKARPFEWIDPPEDAGDERDLVLFNNGLFDVRTGRLWPLDGRYFATATPSFPYDKEATCPIWLAALDTWLDPEFHATVQEFFGYAMTSDNGLEHFLVLLGASRGGKSTMSRVLMELVGMQHCASLTINDLGGPFGLQSAMDKRLIVVPDASDTDLRDRSTALTRLKSITGNDEISVNRKHLPLVNAKLPGQFLLVANRHPKFLDDSGALAARELVISFEKMIPQSERDKSLSAKLREELSGIANWSLAGLVRLRHQRRFTVGKKGQAAVRLVAEAQSPALRFAQQCLIITGDSSDFTSLADVYIAYEGWAQQEGLRGGEWRNRTDFAGDLEAALTPLGVRRGGKRVHDARRPKAGNGRSVHGFRGFKIAGEWLLGVEEITDGVA